MPVDMNKLVSLDRLKEEKATENAMLAAEYSTSKTYGVGDYAYHAGTLYKCTTAITTAEAWTSGHWTAAKIGDDVTELKTALSVLEPTATSADVGKALIAKTVADGKVTEFEFGEAGGGASAIVNSVENVAIASFDDGTASAVKQIVVGIEPVQSGSGDPAPDNVRPITGWTGANVYRSGADTSNPTTIPITFPTEAGTVYGGTLTNLGTDEWKLVTNLVYYNIPSSAWSWRDASGVYYMLRSSLSPLFKAVSSTSANFIGYCDKYKFSSYSNVANYRVNNAVAVRIESSANWLAWTGTTHDNTETPEECNIVLELEEPITYTITASEVIKLLSGYNNVWADTGDIELLEYYADSKTYIDEKNALVKALIAKELPSMVADTALTANDFRIVNNTLYRITTSVASGATLTPNTNCTATTITAVLKSLLS